MIVLRKTEEITKKLELLSGRECKSQKSILFISTHHKEHDIFHDIISPRAKEHALHEKQSYEQPKELHTNYVTCTRASLNLTLLGSISVSDAPQSQCLFKNILALPQKKRTLSTRRRAIHNFLPFLLFLHIYLQRKTNTLFFP